MITSTTTFTTAVRTTAPDIIPLLVRQISAGPSTTPAPTGTFETTKQIIIPGVSDDHVNVPAKTIELVLPTCIQSITPDENGFVTPGSCGALWNYYPSCAAAAIFAVIFGILTAIHIWQAARYKKRWCWVIIMASIWETAALTFRTISTRNQQSSGIYLIFQIFILLAPLWVNAFAYMVLGRMINFFAPVHSSMRRTAPIIGSIFVLLDFVAFVIQLAGGTMASPTTSPEDLRRAINIYMGGIGLQQSFIVIFLGLAVKFHIDMRRAEKGYRTGWAPLLWAVYFSLTMVTVRIIYRLAEFSSGTIDNPLTMQESYFFALEATPMVLAVAAYVVVHPGRVITGPGSEMPGLWSTIKGMFSNKARKVPIDSYSEEQELTTRGAYQSLGR